jgi:maltose alpha-D-glucosyltransferase/alpha-amylase
MQWSADRNGGFSRADFAQLYLPPLMDPVYGFQACNVEAQQRSQSSLLQWLRRFIAVRQRHPVFGEGDFEALEASNPSVFAFMRTAKTLDGPADPDAAPPAARHGERVLCVNNLSRFAQPVELDLRRHAGCVPVELVGKVRFPRITDAPYILTLAPHGFYWFSIEEGPP